MAVINTNLHALNTLNQHEKAQSSLFGAMERLSSGLRVNSAKDDAAGLAIANRMESNLRAGSQVARGINDGISLIQTAEGGLDSINDILQRSRQLAVQASSETLSDTDRASINAEYSQLRDEIDRIAMNTEAFDKYPLAPTEQPQPETKLGNIGNIKEKFPASGDSISNEPSQIVPLGFIPSGAINVTISVDAIGDDDDIQVFTLDGGHIIGTPVGGSDADYVWKQNNINSESDLEDELFTSANGFNPSATYKNFLSNITSYDATGGETKSYGGMTLTYSGDGDRFDSVPNDGSTYSQPIERLHIDKTTEPLFLVVAGSGSFNAAVDWDVMPDTATPPSEPIPLSKPVDIVTSANYGEKATKVTIAPTPSDSTSLGLKGVALDPPEKAREALGKLQQAINQVDSYRGQYGALTNRFEGAIDSLQQQQVDMTAAQSRIIDTDYAVEVSNMTKAQILQQASTSMLAQANQVPQSVLSLLG